MNNNRIKRSDLVDLLNAISNNQVVYNGLMYKAILSNNSKSIYDYSKIIQGLESYKNFINVYGLDINKELYQKCLEYLSSIEVRDNFMEYYEESNGILIK